MRLKFNLEDHDFYRNVAFGVAGDWEVFPRKPILKHDIPFVADIDNDNDMEFLELAERGIYYP